MAFIQHIYYAITRTLTHSTCLHTHTHTHTSVNSQACTYKNAYAHTYALSNKQ